MENNTKRRMLTIGEAAHLIDGITEYRIRTMRKESERLYPYRNDVSELYRVTESKSGVPAVPTCTNPHYKRIVWYGGGTSPVHRGTAKVQRRYTSSMLCKPALTGKRRTFGTAGTPKFKL